MKNILLFATAAMMLAISCSKEDEVTGFPEYGKSGKEKAVFYASTEVATSPETKVYADEDLRLLWNEDDRISVFNKSTFNSQYAFIGEDGDNSGDFEEEPFSGFATGNIIDNIYAVYPYSKENRVNNEGDKIIVYLPETQIYKEHSFGIGANTMVAVTEDNFLGFKNVCGYLKFRFYGDNISVSSISIQGNNGEKISGKAFITPILGEVPSIMMDESANEVITLNCSSPVILGNSKTNYTEFIFAIPPTVFTKGFSVKVTDNTGAIFEKSSSNGLTISRNKIESMGAMKVVPTNFDNVAIDIPDSQFKAYLISKCDSNKDGRLSYSEATNIYSLSISNKNISSLEGIEHFINLQSLTCNNNKLTSLDLSNNTKLTTLDCDYNNLTSLILGHNEVLTSIRCGFNQLSSLDISNCPNLESLMCHYNYQISQLILGNHPFLTVLQCHSNQITSLNVDNCPKLEHLACNENQLTSLNVSNNLALNRLDCSKNSLTTLDVSHNLYLEHLTFYSNQISTIDLSNNIALTHLYASENLFSNIDLSHNIRLTSLYLDHNLLTQIDLSHNIELDYLSCNYNMLTHLDLSNNPLLYGLLCNDNQLTNLNLSNLRAMGTLWCANNNLTTIDVSVCPILEYLQCNGNNIVSLDLTKNKILKQLMAWPQNNTLDTVWIRKGARISYLNDRQNVIKPSDFDTEIIEIENVTEN